MKCKECPLINNCNSGRRCISLNSEFDRYCPVGENAKLRNDIEHYKKLNNQLESKQIKTNHEFYTKGITIFVDKLKNKLSEDTRICDSGFKIVIDHITNITILMGVDIKC